MVEPSKVPFINLSMDTARKRLGALPGQGLAGPLGLADVDSFKKSFHKAGFVDIHTEKIPVTFDFVQLKSTQSSIRSLLHQLYNFI